MARLAATIAACLMLLACSSSAKIAEAASEASRAADTVRDSAASIATEAKSIADRATANAAEAARGGDADLTAIVDRASRNASSARSIASKAEAVQEAAGRVKSSTETVHRELTGVEDTTPWWAGTVAWVAASIVVVAVVFLLWRSGALAFLGGVFSVITPRKRREANLLAKVLDSGTEEGVREFAAAKRAADPAFDRAIAEEMDAVKLSAAKSKGPAS